MRSTRCLKDKETKKRNPKSYLNIYKRMKIQKTIWKLHPGKNKAEVCNNEAPLAKNLLTKNSRRMPMLIQKRIRDHSPSPAPDSHAC